MSKKYTKKQAKNNTKISKKHVKKLEPKNA